MIPQVDIRHDMAGISARLGLVKSQIMPAAVSAINKTMVTVRAEAARKLAEDYRGLGIGTIKRRIKLERADRFVPVGAVVFSAKRLRLFNWRLPRVATRWGTGVRVGARGPQKILRVDAISGRVSEVSSADMKSAFVQRSRRWGTPNIWLRQGKDSVPIDVLVTPALSETVVARRLNETYAKRARERFAITFQQAAARFGKR